MSNLDSSGVRSGLRPFGRTFRFLFGCLFAALPLSAAAQVVAPFLQGCIPGNTVDLSSNGCLGDSVTANATVSGGIPMPARVIFDLHPPGDILCQAPNRTGSITLSAMGSISAPYAHTTTMAGSHRWRAEYAGNAWNLPDVSRCTALSMRVIVNAALFANGFE